METKEEVDLTHEDRFEELLHEEIISHGEDRTIQFIAPFEEEDFDENAEIKEGPRVDVMVEVPLSEVNPLSIQSSDSNEELLPDDFLEMDPEPSQVSTGEKRKGAFCIILSVLCLFLFLNSWFIWITPSKEMSPLYVIEDDTPLSLEWWEDSSRCEGKIAQQVLFKKFLPSFWVETSEGNGCICGALPIDPLEEPMLMALDGRKFYGCTPEEVFGNP